MASSQAESDGFKPVPVRKTGRPRGASTIPWREVYKALVYGEDAVDEVTQETRHVYPSYSEMARRVGCSASAVSLWCRRNRIMDRREEAKKKTLEKKSKDVLLKVAEESGKKNSAKLSTHDAISIIEAFIARFAKSIKEGSVRSDNANDLNILFRLKEFMEGKADSRVEVHGQIGLVAIQSSHKDWRQVACARQAGVDGGDADQLDDRASGGARLDTVIDAKLEPQKILPIMPQVGNDYPDPDGESKG